MNPEAKKKILIWGAGRIGRGFIGDIFSSSDYELVFVDQSKQLIELLNRRGSYTVVGASGKESIQRKHIDRFTALHLSQKDEIQYIFNQIDVMAVATFPKDFENVAAELRPMILARRSSKPDSPLDIILCTNLVHAGPVFTEALYRDLDEEQRAYFDSKIGVVESLIIRMAPPAPDEEVEEDPLIVWTNGYGEFPVDVTAFKGMPPDIKAFRLVDDMRAEEKRKIYTYNMCHAILGYFGYQFGYELLVDCLADPMLRAEAVGALEEISSALHKAYGFSVQEMKEWSEDVIAQTDNRSIGDTVIRMTANPIRKLHKEDRLVGPALLCLKNGVEPMHITRAIAAALHYRNEEDPKSIVLSDAISKKGLMSVLEEICGLGTDPLERQLAESIMKTYDRIEKEIDWHEVAKQAYDLGFEYEAKYHGCGQCSYAAVSEILGCFDPEVFEAATGFCGGIGLDNNQTCSALSGAVMAIGMLYHRSRENFDGDKESKYANFELVQNLIEKFKQEFGTTTCKDIHALKYGRAYDLRKKEERVAFEEAGGHGPKGCTDTVGKASQFAIEVLAEYFLEHDEEFEVHGPSENTDQ